jgi:cytochrome c oxidase assembly factor 3
MGDSQYVNRKSAAKSYRPSGYVRLSPLRVYHSSWKAPQMSQGLLRARAPYRVKNAITGLTISSFAVGVWLYSMSAVKQDNFDDVDEEARAMVMSGVKDGGDKGKS